MNKDSNGTILKIAGPKVRDNLPHPLVHEIVPWIACRVIVIVMQNADPSGNSRWRVLLKDSQKEDEQAPISNGPHGAGRPSNNSTKGRVRAVHVGGARPCSRQTSFSM